eukprot:scaffold318739_cov33-Tisochrysis_lutea.AAC.2
MACMMASREAIGEAAASSSAGGELPQPVEPAGLSVSTKLSNSWWIREKPWEGSLPATSMVERCFTPATSSRSVESGCSVRPAHMSRRPRGGGPPSQ